MVKIIDGLHYKIYLNYCIVQIGNQIVIFPDIMLFTIIFDMHRIFQTISRIQIIKKKKKN